MSDGAKQAEEVAKDWRTIYATKPYGAWAQAGGLAASLFQPVRPSYAGPFALIFAFSGYVTSTGDQENGAGISTAWSLAYLMVNGKHGLRSMRPVPALLTAGAALNATAYGSYYFKF